ncbi:hypothetical protein COSO111634_27460 [Corallococcus soli]
MSKNAWSNWSMSSSTPPAGTKFGCCHRSMPSGRPGRCSSSSGVKREMDSTPSRRFFQKSSTEPAPGKRPAMPMMATSLLPGAWGAFARGGATGAAAGAVVRPRAPPDSRSRRWARPWTVGCSKSHTTGSSCFSSSRRRAETRTTDSDVPARSSKKWSCTPTRSSPSSRAQRAAIFSSSGLPGSTKRPGPAMAPGTGRALRSSLPFGFRGSAGSRTKAVGTMNSGSRWRTCSRSSAGVTGVPAAASVSAGTA